MKIFTLLLISCNVSEQDNGKSTSLPTDTYQVLETQWMLN